MVFVFLFLTYFPQYDNLQVRQCCSKWHHFILSYGQVLFNCVYHAFDKVETRKTIVQGLMPKEPYFYFMISLPLCFSCWISNNGRINSGKKEADRTLSTPPLHGSSGRQSINSHHSSGLLVSDLFSLSLSSCCCFVDSGSEQWQWLQITRAGCQYLSLGSRDLRP